MSKSVVVPNAHNSEAVSQQENLVSSTVGDLAMVFLERSRGKGMVIEIPSLGITINGKVTSVAKNSTAANNQAD